MAKQLIHTGIQSPQGVNVDVDGDPKYIEFAPGKPKEVSDEVAAYLLRVAPERFQDVTPNAAEKKPELVAAGASSAAPAKGREEKPHGKDHRKKR